MYTGDWAYKNYKFAKADWLWIARYGANTGKPDKEPSVACDLWQYTDQGTAPGINGKCDLNKAMRNVSWFIGGENVVKMGSAHGDENGKAHGGQAGDQTGKEVSVSNWRKHEKGWRVFRAKDPNVAEKIAWDMEAACNNNHIGYDQYQRDTLYNAAQKVGFDCSKVAVNCETDCSA